MVPTTEIFAQPTSPCFQEQIGQYLFDCTSSLYLNGYLNWIQILEKKDCKQLKTISLQHCSINDEKLKYLTQFDWRNIKKLQLCYNQLTFASLKVIIFEAKFKNLTRLQIGNNKIYSHGIKILTKSSLPYLHELCLCKTGLCNEGIKYLNKNNFKNLTKLNLRQNNIGINGLFEYTVGNGNKLTNLQIFSDEQTEDSIVNMQLVSMDFKQIVLPFGIKNKYLREDIDNIFVNRLNYNIQQY